MASASGILKRRKHAVHVEGSLPEEEGFSTVPNPDASWGAEPNFNLNLTLTSPSNPRDFSKLQSSKRTDESNKEGGKRVLRGTAAVESRTVLSQDERQKSRIPTLSPAPEVKVNTEGNLFKPPCVKPVKTLSPVAHVDGNTAMSQRSHPVEQTTNDPTARPNSPTSNVTSAKLNIILTTGLTFDLEMQSNAKEQEGRDVNMKTPTQTLCVPISPKRHIKAGEANRISPKLASRNILGPIGTKKTDIDTITNITNPKTSSEISFIGQNPQTQRVESALLCTKTPQVSSLSPHPWTHKTTTNITVGKKSRPNDKESNSSSGLKTNVKFLNFKGTEVSKDCRESISDHSSKSLMGSRDTLDSKSSLDSKPRSRTSPRINAGHKTSKEMKTDVRSRVVQDPESLPDLEAGLTFKTSVKPPLKGPHCVLDLCRSVSPSTPLRSGLKCICASAKPSSSLKAEQETFMSALVQATAESPLEDVSSSEMLSSWLVSASINPGSNPERGSGVSSPGPQKEDKKNTCFDPGNFFWVCSQHQLRPL